MCSTRRIYPLQVVPSGISLQIQWVKSNLDFAIKKLMSFNVKCNAMLVSSRMDAFFLSLSRKFLPPVKLKTSSPYWKKTNFSEASSTASGYDTKCPNRELLYEAPVRICFLFAWWSAREAKMWNRMVSVNCRDELKLDWTGKFLTWSQSINFYPNFVDCVKMIFGLKKYFET